MYDGLVDNHGKTAMIFATFYKSLLSFQEGVDGLGIN